MSHIKPASMVFVLFTVTAFVWASGSDEPGEKAQVLENKAAVAADEEETPDVEGRPETLPEAFERHERREHERRGLQRRHQGFMRELEARIDLLRKETQDGKARGLNVARRIIEQLEEELEARHRRQNHELPEHYGVHGRHPGHVAVHDQPHGEIYRRMEHMQAAIRHLNEAHLPELAEQVEQQLEAVRRELRVMHDHDHNEANVPGVLRQMMGQLEELRHEVGQLRETVNALRDDR